MTNIFQPHKIDGYKLDHISQYVNGTEVVYSNMTPRSDKLARVIRQYFNGKVVFFGLQYAIKKMIQDWGISFFSQPKEEVIKKYSRRIKNYLGPLKGNKQIEAMSKLHDLGYLPLEIKALPEGSRVDMKVPVFTVKNTHPDFFWLTNYVETYLSCMIWPACNAASLSEQYWSASKRFAAVTGAPDFWVSIANHCFAARGHRGEEDAMLSGAGHLLFSIGSDTLWSIDFFEEYYNADSDKEMIACSVSAFEHATATQRIEFFGSEVESVRDAIKNIYPTGILSYVSDSRDYYGFISEGLKELKEDILNRTEDELGLVKFVVRPDSSPKTPLEVICGDGGSPLGTPEHKGSLEILGEIFGITYNDKGFKLLNPKVGLIYGEAITLDMQTKIYQQMVDQGWCVSNVLFGVGSWAYLQDSSRDSYSFAIKGSSSIVDGEELSMQKTPKTAAASKTSARGFLRVEEIEGNFHLFDQQTKEQEQQGALQTVFKDGMLVKQTSLSEIRNRLWG